MDLTKTSTVARCPVCNTTDVVRLTSYDDAPSVGCGNPWHYDGTAYVGIAGTTPLHVVVPVSDELMPDLASRARIEQAAARAVMDVLAGAAVKPGWLVPDGYQPDGVGACRSCHDQVLWVHTRQGKRAPLNPDGTSHFATCPQAPTWRKPTMRDTHPVIECTE